LYVALYEYFWSYCYIGRDYHREEAVLEKLSQVVYPSRELPLKAMEINIDLARRGRAPQADVMIAATAILFGASLLTKDERRFPRMERYGPEFVKWLP